MILASVNRGRRRLENLISIPVKVMMLRYPNVHVIGTRLVDEVQECEICSDDHIQQLECSPFQESYRLTNLAYQ